VPLDSSGGDKETLRNLFIGESLRDERRNLEFAL